MEASRKPLPAPINLAAIDAGSNAIRLVIARAESRSKIIPLELERYPLRLGRHVFFQHRFDRETIEKTVQAFRHFRSLMDLHDIKRYRAVATSATREARNRKTFIERIYEASGIRVEVIDGAEEARLVRCAVGAEVAGRASPRLILDLGGGSLEMSLVKGDMPEESVALPLGTVRVMEAFAVKEAMTTQQVSLIRTYVLSLLRRQLTQKPHSPASVAAACGGNAEALALIAPGAPRHGIKTLDLAILRRKLRQFAAMTIKERMRALQIRKDRAEVIAIAAVILTTVGRWWNTPTLLVPGVGVKEGILIDLLQSAAGESRGRESAMQRQTLLAAARRYAARLNWDAPHAEKVSHLAVSLFDQLQPLHKMGDPMRLTLEIAALLHNIGQAVHPRSHHKHGEYLVRHGEIAGLEWTRRNMVACIIHYEGEPGPDADNKLFTSFPRKQQLQIRTLVAILRIAAALDEDHRQGIAGVKVQLRGSTVRFGLRAKRAPGLNIWAAQRQANFFEAVFNRSTRFQQIR